MSLFIRQSDLTQLEMSKEQANFLWFLDQCGLDQYVRALRHTDIFDRMRKILMSSTKQNEHRLECDIHSSFLLDRWSIEHQLGHSAAQHHYERFWQRSTDRAQKSNFIDVKLREIEAGSAPVHVITQLSLPKGVKDVGSKQALLLMLQLPEGVLYPYQTWAQNLCFIDHLIGIKPDYDLLLDLRFEYHKQFERIYKSELRQLNKRFLFSQTTSEKRAFYKKLFKYPYPVKRDIFRCLCESELNRGQC